MYFHVETLQNVFKIDETFATLLQIDNDNTLEFEFRYTVRQSSVVKNNATKVEISVINRTVKKADMLEESSPGRVDTKSLINNIITDMLSAKSALKNQEKNVLAIRNSDTSSAINNEIAGQLSRGKTPADIQSMYGSQLRTVRAIDKKVANDPKPIIHSLNLQVENPHLHISASIEENYQHLAHDLILRRGIDPSLLTSIVPKVVHAYDAFQGTSRSSTLNESVIGTLNRAYDHLTLQHKNTKPAKTIDDIEDDVFFDTIDNQPRDNVEVPVRVRFKPPSTSLGSRESVDVLVRFRLIDVKTGHVVDEVTKPLPVMKHVRAFLTPTYAPRVKQVTSEVSSHANLSIEQIDPRADAVFIYKKTLSTSSVLVDGYSLIGVYRIENGKRALVQVDRSTYNATIYRIVPSYHGVIGSAFVNVVIPPKMYRPVRAVSLTAKLIDNGIRVEARNFPPDVISIQFLQRNLTTHEEKYTNVEEPKFLDDVARMSNYTSVVSFNVLDANVYEFAVRGFKRDGTVETFANETIEYVLPQPDQVIIKISNVDVSHDDQPNVTFGVDLDVVPGSIDVIKSLLEKDGIKAYFEGDIMNQRDELSRLLTVTIHRIDLTTGEREDMGILTNSSGKTLLFDDKVSGKKHAASALQRGHKYRYVITAASRSAETVFDGLMKTKTDQVTKKQYTYSPAKFLHPLALKSGVLVSSAGLQTRYAKSTFEHGVLGSNQSIDISLDDDSLHVVDARATRFDRIHNVITWRLIGDMSTVDHFVVMKVVHDIKTVIGVVHTQFSNNSCEMIHHLQNTDRGQLTYSIVPVLNDYKSLSTISTNSLIV